MSKRISLGCRGETVVEVLLAVAIVSMVLGAAYVSANRSVSGLRQSQERGEALKIVESQIELLKGALAKNPSFVGVVCVGDDLAYVPYNTAPCKKGPGGRYVLSIEKRPDNAYATTATWDTVGGGDQEQLTIIYRTET